MGLELPAEMMQKVESLAHSRGETANSFVVLAVAERLARLEHERWLAENQHGRDQGTHTGTTDAPLRVKPADTE